MKTPIIFKNFLNFKFAISNLCFLEIKMNPNFYYYPQAHQFSQQPQQYPQQPQQYPHHPHSFPAQYHHQVSHNNYFYTQNAVSLDNAPYLAAHQHQTNTTQIQGQITRPIIIEKVQKQQFLIEKPVITREIIYQHEPMYQAHTHQITNISNQQPSSPMRLKKSHSLSQISNVDSKTSIILMKGSQILETPKRSIPELTPAAISIDKEKIYEEKIQALEKQIFIFKKELEGSYKDIDDYKKRLSKYEFLMQDYEIRLKTSSNSVQEIENYKVLLAKKDEEISLLQHEIQQREELKTDLNKISGYLSSKIKETEEFKVRLSEKDAIFSEIEKKMQILMDEVERLNGLLKKKIEEVSVLSIRINEYEAVKIQYHDKNEVLSLEIDRLNAIIRENIKELESWRFKYTEFSGLTLRVQDLLLNIVLMAGEIECLRERIANSEKEVQEMRRSNILKTLA